MKTVLARQLSALLQRHKLDSGVWHGEQLARHSAPPQPLQPGSKSLHEQRYCAKVASGSYAPVVVKDTNPTGARGAHPPIVIRCIGGLSHPDALLSQDGGQGLPHAGVMRWLGAYSNWLQLNLKPNFENVQWAYYKPGYSPSQRSRASRQDCVALQG
jgi:hypothetical protein